MNEIFEIYILACLLGIFSGAVVQALISIFRTLLYG